MRTVILMILGCMCALLAQAQEEFTIFGKVNGVKDGTVVTLFRLDGNTGKSIAKDTVMNETFRFRSNTTENNPEKLAIMCLEEAFPPMKLDIWVAPGAEVNIKGDNNYLYTWDVKSSIEQQRVRAGFVDGSRDLWNEYQRISVEDKALSTKLYGNQASEDEKNRLRAQRDSLKKISNTLRSKIAANEIEHLRQTPVTEVWMETLENVAQTAVYQKDFPYKQETLAIYEGLPEEMKNTEHGKNIRTILLPPVVVNEGDEMADADLFDLDGKVHRLADYNGKYILVDFWSAGCGPSVMAKPEMKEIAEQYKDRLTVVSLSIDKKGTWTMASKEHDIAWENLNELQGANGLFAKYGVDGTPGYILISPDGKVIRKWSGYGKGLLKNSMRRWIDTANHTMSVVTSGTTTIVNYPTFRFCNTDIHEIKQVECSDTATIVRVHGYYVPGYWIRVSSSIALIADNGTVCPLKRAEGITPDEKFIMPESGEADYTFVFEPLPKGTKSFDMIERTVEKPDRIEGISLSMPQLIPLPAK